MTLPTPRLARPVPAIDPHRHRDAYACVVSALQHASPSDGHRARLILARLGVDVVAAPSAAMRALWAPSDDPALHAVVREALGHAFVHNLAFATTDAEIRAILCEGLAEQRARLDRALEALESAMRAEADFASRFARFGASYARIAARAAEEQRPLTDALGLDHEALRITCARFVLDVIAAAVARAGRTSLKILFAGISLWRREAA